MQNEQKTELTELEKITAKYRSDRTPAMLGMLAIARSLGCRIAHVKIDRGFHYFVPVGPAKIFYFPGDSEYITLAINGFGSNRVQATKQNINDLIAALKQCASTVIAAPGVDQLVKKFIADCYSLGPEQAEYLSRFADGTTKVCYLSRMLGLHKDKVLEIVKHEILALVPDLVKAVDDAEEIRLATGSANGPLGGAV